MRGNELIHSRYNHKTKSSRNKTRSPQNRRNWSHDSWTPRTSLVHLWFCSNSCVRRCPLISRFNFASRKA